MLALWRGAPYKEVPKVRQRKKRKKDDSGADNKCAEVKGGQLHNISMPSVDVQSGIDFSGLGEDNEFAWHQFHVEVWVSQDFEVHALVDMHNATGRAVPLIWLLLDSQLTVDLIANPKMLVNIKKVRGKDTIRVHCNSRVNIVDSIGDLLGYGTVYYEPTGTANILSMSRAMRKYRFVFDSESRIFFQYVPP